MRKHHFGKTTTQILSCLAMACLLFGCGAKEPERITSSTQLNDSAYTVGISQGASGQSVVEEKYPNAKKKYYTRDIDAYMAVQQGKIDAFVYDRVTMEFAIAEGLKGVTLLPENIGEPINIAIGISPKSSVPNLQAKLNEFLATLRKDGTLEDMGKRWINEASDTMPEIPKAEHPEITIKVGTTGMLRPFSYYKGDQLCGYDIELINRFALWMNAKVEVSTYDYDGIVPAAESGSIDCIIANLHVTEERKQSIDFSDNVYESYNAVMVPMDGTAVEVTGNVPLESANFGVMTGSTAEIYLGDTYPLARISTFSAIADAMTALSNGKVDYVITAYTTALNAVRLNPSLEIARKDVIMESSGIAVSKENTQLLTQLNEVLSEFRTDGTLDEIVSNWTTQGQDYVREPRPVSDGQNGILRVAVSADREPMCFVMDGKYEGLDCDLIERIAYEMGMKVEYQNMQFSSLVAAIASNKADVVISNMTPTEERKESVNFTETYFDNPQVLVARKLTAVSEEGEYTELSQLSDKVLSCISGSIFDQLTLNVIPDAKFVYFNSATEELTALKSGKIDGFPIDEPVAKMFVAQNLDLTIVPEVVVEDHYAMVLAKDSPLTAEFNREIKALKEQGILEEMFDKWSSADNSGKTLPDRDYPAPNGTLRVACSVGLEPMCYSGSNGVPLGFEVEMALRIGEALGKKVELISVDFAGLIPMIQSGKADVAIGCMSISDERKQMVDMTDSHYDGGVVMVVRKASVNEVEKAGWFDDLKQSFTRTFLTENRWKLVLNGLLVTVILSICSGILGSVLGFGICMLRRSKRRFLSIPAAVFIRMIQGTPIVVLLMILYYIVFGQLDISAVLVAILGFAVNFGVYVSEMIRTGIDAVDKGQIEAAYALGFTKIRTFWKITFPQAARHFLPVLKGEFISMVKMTSVVGYIAIQDLTKVSDIIRSRTLEAFFPLIATAVLYFMVANLLTIILSRLEIRLDPKRRKCVVKGVVTK